MRLFPVKIDEKIGFINPKGEVAVAPRFTSGGDFSEGLAQVRIGENKFYINEKGEIVFQTPFVTWDVFHDRRCIMVEDDKKGYLDDRGNVVIPPQYHDASVFHNGYAVVKPEEEGPARLIDVNGRTVMEDSGLDYKSHYEDGLVNLVTRRHGRTCAGFVDLSKNWVIEPEYAEVYPFHEGLAAVRHMRTRKFGFINRKNMFQVEARFNGRDIWFSEGLCPVEADGYTGFIDRDGMVIIDARFYYAEHFSCGRSRVEEVEDGKEGFIDKDGKWVVEPRFEFAMAYEDGVAVVDDGYIDLEGNYIWKDQK
jgi:hypothetical protein